MALHHLRKSVGALVREFATYVDIVAQRRDRPAVLFFPSQGMEDGASRLRAYNIAQELRSWGWRTATCPKHLGLAARRRLVRAMVPDVIVMQTTRHTLNRPELFPGTPIVIDLDDADYIDPASARPLVEALRTSAGVIAGSRTVARFCRQHNDKVCVVWTGTPPSIHADLPQPKQDRIVTWAASSLLGSPQEASFVREVLEILAAKKVDFTFRLYSDDGSQAYRTFINNLVPTGVKVETKPFLYYPEFLTSLDAVAIGLAPLVNMDGFSSGKSFGKVLAYLDRRVLVISHPVVDHPLFFQHEHNGLMLDTPEEWAGAVAHFLDHSDERCRITTAAFQDFEQRLSCVAAAHYVNFFLRDVLSTAKN